MTGSSSGPMVIGITGKMGSGKDVLAGELSERCGAVQLTVGDLVREIADQRGWDKTRSNLQAISEELYQRRGEAYFMKRMIARIEAADREVAAVSGIRSPRDVSVLRDHFRERFLLAAVGVKDPRLRFERLKKRSAPRDPRTWEEFQQRADREEELFDIPGVMEQADVQIDNSGSLADFRQSIQEGLIARLGDRCS